MTSSLWVWVGIGAVVGAVLGIVVFEGFGAIVGAMFGAALGFAFHGFSSRSKK